MNHKEKAINYFSQKLHCSQAVLAAVCVRIAFIAEKRQNSALFIFQNLFTFSITNLLFESSHWPEHSVSSISY